MRHITNCEVISLTSCLLMLPTAHAQQRTIEFGPSNHGPLSAILNYYLCRRKSSISCLVFEVFLVIDSERHCSWSLGVPELYLSHFKRRFNGGSLQGTGGYAGKLRTFVRFTLKITTSASKLYFTAVSNSFFYWSVSLFLWFLHFTGLKSETIILKHKHYHKVHLEYLKQPKQPLARPTENSWSFHATLDIRTWRRKQTFGKTVIPSLEILSVYKKVTVFERSQIWHHFLIELHVKWAFYSVP